MKTDLKNVNIYTDGACSGNPGPGGWAALLTFDGPQGRVRREMCGGFSRTTNNRMELTAVINALSALKTACDISLYTDSKYVMDGITSWLPNWKRNGWKTSNKKTPVKNMDLWQRLDELTRGHEIRWIWVKGHAGHPENERVDELARTAIKNLS